MKRMLTNQKETQAKEKVCSQKGKLKPPINTHTRKTSQHHQLTGKQEIKYILFFTHQSGKPFKNELVRHNGKRILITASGIKTDIIILESNLGSNYSNFKKCAPFNPAIPFLGMCPKDILTYSLQVALKNGKLPKHQ